MVTDLNRVKINHDYQDKVVWTAEEGGLFFVKSAYQVLELFIPSERSQSMEMLWEIKVVPNALMLAWKVLKGKIPTRVNLHRRGIVLPSSMCPLCNQEEETVNRLFVECKVAYKVCVMVSKWVGVQVVYSNDMKHHLLQFTLP